jgi:hypothetical protein
LKTHCFQGLFVTKYADKSAGGAFSACHSAPLFAFLQAICYDKA